MTNSNSARILYHDQFDGNGFTNENSLANALLTRPDKINPVITHLAGREDKKFPLTFLTEGQPGGIKPIEINDVQYEWDTFKRIRKSDAVVSTAYGSTDTPGINGTPIFVIFQSNWLKVQHNIVSPNGVTCRIMERPQLLAGGNYQYRLQINNADPTAYVAMTELAAGNRWSMEGGANVSESYSMGNESNKVTPGKMKNQIGFLRKSYEWGGNVANKTVEVRFNVNGSETNMWMPFERWQHTLDWKQVVEENQWYSTYNRKANGEITMKDPDSQLPIPMGAGVVDQIPNQDTYSFLTATKIKNTVGDVMYGSTDTGAMDVVLYTGYGGLDEFDGAMKTALGSLGFSIVSDDKFVKGAGRNLVFGGFFTQYEHIDGHVITVKRLPLLDFGARAESAHKHPVSGRPLTSYDMYFLDQSTYDGVKNVQAVTQKGRAMITGVLKGMSPTPMDFAGNATELIATEQDKCSVHFFSARGTVINRNTHCFKLSCSLS